MRRRTQSHDALWWARAELRQRAALTRLGGLPIPLRALVFCCWILAVVTAVVILVAGRLKTVPPPTWLWMVVLGSAAAAAAAATTAGATARGSDFVATLRTRVAVWSTGLLPVAFLWAERAGWEAVAAAAIYIATGIALAWPLIHRRPHGRILFSMAAVGVATPWLLLTSELTTPFQMADYLWLQAAGIGTSAVYAGAYLAVAAAAERRHEQVKPWLRDDILPRTVIAVLVIKVVIVVSRLTWARDAFADGTLWTVRDLSSWPHAVLVAVLIMVLVIRTQAQALRPDGQRLVTYVLVAAAASAPLANLVDLVLSALIAGARGQPVTVGWTFAVSHWFALMAVVALAALLALRRYARTAGRTMAAVAIAYLTPAVLAIALSEENPNLQLPGVWATSVQVDIALTAVVVVTLALAWLQRRRGRSRGTAITNATAVRLLIVPTLALHAAIILPEIIEGPLGRPLIVAGALVALVLLPPLVAPDNRPGDGVLTASAVQLTVLVVYLLAVVSGFDDNPTSEILGVLWLAVPVSTVLCSRLTSQPDVAPAVRQRAIAFASPLRDVGNASDP